MRRIAWIAVGVLAVCACATAFYEELGGAFDGAPDHPAIGYQKPSTDAVAALNEKIAEGSVVLKYEQNTGYLRPILDALHVPVESQIVAMSKTSVQQYIITPQNPRTLYFNDFVAVGYVRGGFVELAVQDPRQGIIFYTLGRSGSKPKSFSGLDRPTFRREDGCLGCHVSYASMGVPGTLLRSVFPATN
jgi:hypothetical protein